MEIDLVKEVECLISFGNNYMHSDVLESCNKLIKILENVREQAVANIKQESEVSKAVRKMDKEYKYYR